MFLSLINISKAQIFLNIKDYIINKNQNLIFTKFKIVLLDFKNFNNNQKFNIIDFISSFRKNHFFKKKQTIKQYQPKLNLVKFFGKFFNLTKSDFSKIKNLNLINFCLFKFI